MNIRQRSLSLLLSVVMVFMFMPAPAFAAGASEAKKLSGIEYSGNTVYEPAGTDENGEVREAYFSGFWTPGNRIILTWEDGTKESYISRLCEYYDSNSGTADTTVEYFRENEEPSKTKDEDGYPVNRIMGLGYYPSGEASDTFIVFYDYPDEPAITEVKGKTPVEITYSGPAICYQKWDDGVWGDAFQEGAEITIKYSDGSTGKAVCRKWGTNKDDDGNIYDEYDYFFEGTEPDVRTRDDGSRYVTNSVWFSFDWDNATASGVPVKHMGAEAIFPVHPYPKPTKAKFIASGGKAVKARIGQDYLELGGKGNKIIISFSDGSKREYKYKNSEKGFIYKDSGGSTDSLSGYADLKKRVPKGTNTVKGSIEIWAPGYDKAFSLDISAKAKASKYYTYVEYRSYTYNGKKKTPEVRVKYYNGKRIKTMPASWYTVDPEKNRKIGYYYYKVSIKKKYQSRYGKSLYGYYDICPKKPVISSVKAGTGSLTVSWKKFSRSNRNVIDGFKIEYSTDRNFEKDYGMIEAKKSSSKKTIRGLKNGKTYYVRISAFKSSKFNGRSIGIWSDASKTGSAKVN